MLHASLAGYVAAWEAYLEQLVRDFFDVTSAPLQPAFNAVHSLLHDLSTEAVRLFNTPHAENSRNLLLAYTGFDPWPYWTWPARRLSAVQVRERLAEILKVRHSFAHGFNMPSYSWNTTPTGHIGLNWQAIGMTERFVEHLVRRTDAGMRDYILTTYARRVF